MKDAWIKLKCFLLGHIWMYENNPDSVFPKRQCSRCGLLHEKTAHILPNSWIRYKDKGFKGTQQEVNDALQKWKDERGIIEG